MTTRVRDPKPEPRSLLTADEAFESLTYYDLQKIKANWKVSISQMEERGDEVTYALVWLIETRTNPEARAAEIKRMTLKEINEYFTAAEDADDDEQEGKDGPPTTKPNGASTPDNLSPPIDV